MFSDYPIKIELVIDGSIKDILLRDVKSQEASKKYNGRNQEWKKHKRQCFFIFLISFTYFILYLNYHVSFYDPSSSLNYKGNVV